MHLLDKWFKLVQRYFGVFFWVGWLYVFFCIGLIQFLELPVLFERLLVLPLNLISWPVAITAWKTPDYSSLPRPTRKMVFGLVVISTLLPLF